MPDRLRISRLATRIATTFSVVLALAFPVGYFLIAYQFAAGSLEAEADINASTVSGLIGSNPVLWRFEQVRLEELLARRPHNNQDETRCIFDRDGNLVAESGPKLSPPLLRSRHELLDAGVPAGHLEITRSLRPLLVRTALAALLGLVFGFLVFRIIPYREIIRAQKILLDGNVFLETVMESSTNAIVVVGLDRRIRMANRRGLQLCGYNRQELDGRDVITLFEAGAREQLKAGLAEISRGNSSSVSMETLLLCRDGRSLELSCGIAEFSQNDAPAGFVICAEDITERKKWEQQLRTAAAELEETNAELRSFAYIISHDLRAPLVNIKGFSSELNGAVGELNLIFQAVAERLEDKQRSRASLLFEQELPEALEFINSSVLRMDRFINAVLKLSRLGHREFQGEAVSVRDLVGAILKSMSHQLEARCTKVDIGWLPELYTDRIALEQILGNLLDNAVKYLDPSRPGELEIHGECGSSGVTIHIRDNGRGVAREDLGKIFEIFRRAGRQDVQGDGMGLAYVKALVRKLRGQIWCESEPGQGSTFSFSIPQDYTIEQGTGI